MPIQIRELVIKATVNSGEPEPVESGLEPEDRAELIQACVAQVMELLKQRSER
jgi:hypothetical protein